MLGLPVELVLPIEHDRVDDRVPAGRGVEGRAGPADRRHDRRRPVPRVEGRGVPPRLLRGRRPRRGADPARTRRGRAHRQRGPQGRRGTRRVPPPAVVPRRAGGADRGAGRSRLGGPGLSPRLTRARAVLAQRRGAPAQRAGARRRTSRHRPRARIIDTTRLPPPPRGAARVVRARLDRRRRRRRRGSAGRSPCASRIAASLDRHGFTPPRNAGRPVERTSGGTIRARTDGSRTSTAVPATRRPGSHTSTRGSASRFWYHAVAGPKPASSHTEPSATR